MRKSAIIIGAIVALFVAVAQPAAAGTRVGAAHAQPAGTRVG